MGSTTVGSGLFGGAALDAALGAPGRQPLQAASGRLQLLGEVLVVMGPSHDSLRVVWLLFRTLRWEALDANSARATLASLPLDPSLDAEGPAGRPVHLWGKSDCELTVTGCGPLPW